LILVARAYAVSGGNRLVGIVLMLLVIMTTGVSIGTFTFPITSVSSAERRLGLAQAIGVLMIDGLVMAITLYFTWTSRGNFRNVSDGKVQSLLSLFLYQGIVRFFIVFTWELADAISRQIENRFLIGVDVSLEIVISTILLCRFILELRKFSDKRQDIPSSQVMSETISDFRARVRTLNEGIMHDFGPSIFPTREESLMLYTNETELQTHPVHQHASLNITAEEFPWAVDNVTPLSLSGHN